VQHGVHAPTNVLGRDGLGQVGAFSFGMQEEQYVGTRRENGGSERAQMTRDLSVN